MKTNFKKLMLAGTAIVAVSAFGAQAYAADEFVVDTNASGTFTTAAPDETADTAFDWGTNVNAITSQSKDVRVDATGAIDLVDGDIIGDGTGNAVIANTTGLTLTLQDAGGADASAADTATVAGNVSANGNAALNLAIAANAGDTNGAFNVDVNGNVDLGTGTITVTSQDNGSNAALNVSGNITSGTITLTENTSVSTLRLDGLSTAQTVTGAIAGTGAVVVQNAAGVTFNSAVVAETITIEDALTNNSSATFKAAVTAATTLGGTGTGTNTVTFDGTGAGFAVTGAIAGAAAGETNVINAIGGNTITLTGAGTTANIDAVNVSGTGTTLTTDQNLTATNFTVATGSTLATTANTVTGAIANNGTLQLGGGSVDGNITGTGLLDVNVAGAIDGSITQGTAEIANVTLTQTSADGYSVGTTTFTGAASTLALDFGDQTVAGNFTNTVDANGTITIADGAGTTTFNGNLGASTTNSLLALTFGAGATAQSAAVKGNLFVDTITLDSDDTLLFNGGGNQTVSGAILGRGAGEGLIVVDNNSNVTFAGVLGGTALQGFSVASGSTANISNNLTVNTTAVSGSINLDGTLNVDTTANTVTVDDAGTGIMALDGTLNVTGDSGFTIGSGGTIHAGWNDTAATMNAGDTVTLQDAFLVGGPTPAAGGNSAVGDVYTVNAVFRDTNGGTDTGFNPTAATVIVAGGNDVTVATGSKLKLGLKGSDTVAFNAINFEDAVADNITWISGASAGSNLSAAEVAGRIELLDTAFVNQTAAAGSNATTLISTLTLNSTDQALGGNDTYAGAANTLVGMPAANRTGNVATARQNLLLAANSEAANDIAESISPTVDAGAVIGATSFVTQTSNITNTQLASLRDGTEATGMYAGNVTNGLRGWVQGFGLTGDQDERDGVSGYDVDSYGVAVGMDTQSLVENWVWGLAFAYSDTDVDSDGVNQTNTDIDSYQVSLYTSYDLDDRTYIAGQAGYVWGDNEQTRSNVGGITGLTADADYDSDVIFAGLEAGRRYLVGGNTVLTPKALVNYQHYDADGYTETGAGGLNLTTSGEEIDLFEIGVGVDASWDYQQADGSFLQPKIGVGVRHDLIGDEYQTTSTFGAGGASFQTEGFDPAQTTFNVSADVTYFSTTNWELSAGYDFEIKSDYDSHAGTLKAAYKF